MSSVFARSMFVAAPLFAAAAIALMSHALLAQNTDSDSATRPDSTESDRANTGSVVGIGFEEQPALLWKFGEDRPWFGGIAVHDGVLVAIERRTKRLLGVDVSTGSQIWQHEAGDVFSYGMGLIMTCDPQFDAVIVGCDSGLIALDRKSGKVLWNHETEMGVDGPTIAAGLVIAGGSDGNIHAVDLKTGRGKWKHDYLVDAPDDPEGFDGERARFSERPARPQEASSDGETVFLSIFDQCRTLAIDVKSGNRKWTFQSKGWMRSRPSVTEDTVYVASQDKHFYAVDKQTGQERWNIKTNKWNSTSAAITDRSIVFGSNDGNVYAILRGMGSPMWEYDLTGGGKVRGSIYSRPLVSGETVYAAAISGTLHAIDLESGKAKWTFDPAPDSEISGDLHFDDGRMFVYTRSKDGGGEAAIYALGKAADKASDK